MKKIIVLILSLCLSVQLVYGADKAIVYDDTNRKLKVSDPLPVAQGGTGSTANANAANGVVVLDASSKLPAVDASQVTGLTASQIPDLAASKITTDTMATARLGSGTASSTTYLRGDQSWHAVPSTSLGAWVDKSSDYGAQQASTDGFVVVTVRSYSHYSGCIGYTDVNSDPTTARIRLELYSMEYGSAMMPVKKSDYWKIVLVLDPSVVTVYWIPLGS